MSIKNPPNILDYALLFGLAATWGSSFVFIKVGVSSIPPITMTVYRLAVPAILLAAYYLLKHGFPEYDRKTWTYMVLASFFGISAPFLFISWGQRVVEPGLTAILMAIMPLLTVAFAHIFTHDEKFRLNKGIGVVLGLAGIIILVGPSALLGLGGDFLHQAAILAAAACYAFNAIIIKNLLHISRLGYATWSITLGFLSLLPFAYYIDGPFSLAYDRDALLSTVLLGVVHTAGAAFVLFAIISRQGATFFSQINLLVPIFGVFWAFLIFSEEPAINTFIALFIILTGVLVAQRQPKQTTPKEV